MSYNSSTKYDMLIHKVRTSKKHMITWRHQPVGTIENQINHILATKGIRTKTVDTRKYRGAQAKTEHI